jgi:hypothetical protein
MQFEKGDGDEVGRTKRNGRSEGERVTGKDRHGNNNIEETLEEGTMEKKRWRRNDGKRIMEKGRWEVYTHYTRHGTREEGG